MKNRYNSIDTIRAIAIIFVVIGHVIDIMQIRNRLTNEIWQIVYDAIYTFHMPMFFVVSGFVECINRKNIGIKDSLVKNIISLYVPYVVFNFVYWLERALAGVLFNVQMVEGAEKTWSEILPLFYMGKGPSWFILALLLIKTVFHIFDYYLSDVWANLILFICFAAYYLGVAKGTFWSWLSYGIFFVVGYYLSKYLCYVEKKKYLVGTASLLMLVLGIKSFVKNGLSLEVKVLVGISVTVILFLILHKKEKKSWCYLLGQNSMVVLMVHWIVQGIMEVVIFNVLNISSAGVGMIMLIISQLIIAVLVIYSYKNVKILYWIEYFFYPWKLWTKKASK